MTIGPSPLGAVWDGEGTSFSLLSAHASGVELCLFDEHGTQTRIELMARTADRWHRRLPGVGPGQRYGYRVHGPYEPQAGRRFNPSKLLVDPYARAIDGTLRWSHGNPLPYVPGGPETVRDDADDAAAIPKCVVVDPAFDWEGVAPPRRSWAHTVIYETHVRGFTIRHPAVREDLRGTFAGLASDAAIGHLKRLGVTAVELLPVHQHADERFLVDRGLTNYWGYNSIGYFAPHAAYAATGSAGEQVREFKGMVKALHRAGIEVILDVVYNHTAEGDRLGPLLSLRGIDDATYYLHPADDPGAYRNLTGTGNTLDTSHPSVLALIVDSLRYWVADCHVDGFRFDLATALAREDGVFEPDGAFLRTLRADPLLSQVKLIAEPWDIGPDGFQLGRFPAGWSEWNAVYRDTVRDWWRGRATREALAEGLSGSPDLYERRGPSASINYVTAHDGFTLADHVAYEHKHNEGNREDNRDGTDDNRSWNCGVEGPTGDGAVAALRARQQRNHLATLLLSRGVPMLLGGDELGRSQGANNNAWCQDSEISWYPWGAERHELAELTSRLVALRAAHAVLHARPGPAPAGARWFDAAGRELAGGDWDGDERDLVLFLGGAGDALLLCLNAGREPLAFTPRPGLVERWVVELATDRPAASPASLRAGAAVELAPFAMAVLSSRSLRARRAGSTRPP
ncbi:MAG: isoamylase [Solirubrobacteraceae bacterium]|nr:isoamylase [Solirubrobacteraceae bacterium]